MEHMLISPQRHDTMYGPWQLIGEDGFDPCTDYGSDGQKKPRRLGRQREAQSRMPVPDCPDKMAKDPKTLTQDEQDCKTRLVVSRFFCSLNNITIYINSH